ncbi:hypothetical protein [Bradyrhizobium sp. 930_D9_N1_4]|uniref:hypothetical protein n=1 Tax=Bradyrhizobium sp. 930_D9_N1_4 TaxID=3240374 RepID=UPI003F8B20E3
MTIDDYIVTTRRPNVSTLPALVSAYERLYHSILAVSSPLIKEVTPTLRVVNTLNKQTQLISIRGGYHLVHDQYLGQTLNLLTKYFTLSAPIEYARAAGFRLVSEAATCCGHLDLATYFALAYSVSQHAANKQKIGESPDLLAKRALTTSVQETFVIAHEMAHLVWRMARFDPVAIDWLLEFLLHEDETTNVNQAIEDYLDDLSFQYHGKAIPHSTNIKTEAERVEDARFRAELRQQFIKHDLEEARSKDLLRQSALFREEIYADHAAAEMCVELFQSDMDWVELITAIHLALENVTTLSMIAQHSYKVCGLGFDLNPVAVATRKRALRRALEDWTEKRIPDQPHLGHTVLSEANRRYMRFVRDPITLDVTSRISAETLPSSDDLREARKKLLKAHPEAIDPQFIIRHLRFG